MNLTVYSYQKKICGRHLNNDCKYGDKCRFYHFKVIDNTDGNIPCSYIYSENSKDNTIELPKVKRCSYMQYCNKANCPFLHIRNVVVYSLENIISNNKNVSDHEECPVCLEEQDISDVYILPCKHSICLNCISPLYSDNKLKCPMCRHLYHFVY